MSDTTTNRRQRAAGARRDVKVERRWRAVAWEWLKAIAWALAAALLIRQFLFQAFRIPTGSMKNTLLIHDYLFVNKFIYGAKTPDRIVIPFAGKTLVDDIPHVRFPAVREPRQGDIIVFEYPENRNVDYIKRCVAVAGDTVLVRAGVLTVNGAVYESNYADRDGDHSCIPHWRERDSCPEPRSLLDPVSLGKGPYNREFGPLVVPPGHLFMMGDNRYNSQDSRYWGALPVELVKGKAEIIYWSFENTFFIPRFERLLKLIDLAPGRQWVQAAVRIGVALVILASIVYYRRRERRHAREP
ncbi:MAG TPA: signal peptidase I [Candidatus Krumholzibacteria bacterium]|nr:signal peptidase I [Candidatus Krumholzibacteria bacterium]HPD71093.1 signal peptidase I [Candidatus Krumholzibacteria bacterium]HRY39207.1 signal peptidase I [Candidatus Krumholzibacteria bacterium]